MEVELRDESGTIRKKWTGRLPVALLYPNVYSIAISNLGYQLVYDALNAQEDLVCERFVYPQAQSPFRSLESSHPLRDFPLVLASVSFEQDYPRLAAMLLVGEVPPLAQDRAKNIAAGMPLVLIGGVAMFMNPEPLAPFADLVAVGEVEAILPHLLPLLRTCDGIEREELLKQATFLPGCYAPTFYSFSYGQSGEVLDIQREEGLPPRIVKVIAPSMPKAGHSVLYSPQAELDMHMVELGRGCSRACRFCAAGFIYRPPRLWPHEKVEKAMAARPTAVDRVGLLGMEMVPDLSITELAESLSVSGCMLSFSSLRADRLSPQLLSVLGKSSLKSAAIAADGASERLRKIINKGISGEDLLQAAVLLANAGIYHLKVYVMIGLPGETMADICELAELIREMQALLLPLGRKRGRVMELTLSVNCFVPKPWTPFQYCSFGGDYVPLEVINKKKHLKAVQKGLRAKFQHLRELLSGQSNIRYSFSAPESALEQAVYARADRRIAPVLLKRGSGAMSFKQAMELHGLDPWDFAVRRREQHELFCWEIIDHGIKASYLWQEYERSLKGVPTPPCQPEQCRLCGVCHGEI